MALKKQINGSDQISTLEIGLTIKNMDLVSSIIQMAINMKADGKPIRGMVKVLIGWLIQKINLEGSIQETGNQIKNKAEAPCSINQETGTMVCGWTIIHMEKEE